jgi:ArsR family transcriptional regulator
MRKFGQSRSLALLLRALADRTRLRLLNLLAGKEMCVCYFVEALQMSQPKISRHLAYLRRYGIVTTRRDHRWIHYQLQLPRDPGAARLLRDTLAVLSNDPQMERDRLRLSTVCSAPQKFGQVKGAPIPTGAAPLDVVRDENDKKYDR